MHITKGAAAIHEQHRLSVTNDTYIYAEEYTWKEVLYMG